MNLFQNKYRTASHRKPNWDYSWDGFYFITLVTKNRECLLGKIENNMMVLSDFGVIVQTVWNKSFHIRHELLLDEYVIMPNHIHAIIVLENPKTDDTDTTDVNVNANANVEPHGRVALPPSPSPPSPHRKPKSISSFVAGFKSAVVSEINNYIDDNNLHVSKYNKSNRFFQPNYHDHIIRDDRSLENIRNYITHNPQNWNNDKLG